MKKILTILFFLSTPVIAVSDGILPSTEWQKNKLVHEINSKLERRLDAVIKDKKYLIDITINTSLPEKPDFSLGDSKAPKKQIKFNNASPDKSNGDYIVFSKFGLEVPAISAQENKEDEKSEKSEYEFLWKYNQSLNIFKNIEDINVKFTLTDKLPESKRSEIKDLISKTDLGLGDIQPNYTFEYVNFNLLPEDVVTAAEEKASLWDNIGRFSNAIGLLLATLLLGVFAFLLMKKFEQIKKDEKARDVAQAQNNHGQEDSKDKTNEMNLSGQTSENDESTSGVQRFQNYFEKNPDGATFLIKRWINSGTEDEKKALCLLVKTLENRHLIQIFERVSLKERETWKQTLTDSKSLDFNPTITDQFIGSQVIEEMIVPNMIEDRDLQEALMNLSDASAAQFMKGHIELGSYLIELLSNKRVSSILNFMEPKVVKSLLKNSSKLTKEDISLKIDELKMAIAPFSKPNKDNTFVQKICELLLISSSQNDEALYESLREENAWEAAKRTARKVYPSFLIKTLPERNLQQILSSYPHLKKSQLIFILDENDREHFLNSLGEKGSTVREMIEIEMENFEIDKESGDKLIAQKAAIWEEFVRHARKQISATIDATPIYLERLNYWLDPQAEIIDFPVHREESRKKEA